jgi:Family of unknown function (DUF5683)
MASKLEDFSLTLEMTLIGLRNITCLVLILLSNENVNGQQVVGERDTVKIDAVDVPQVEQATPISSYAKRFDPRKALLYAAVFPGSGQVYNKKYWKLPIVYGGFFGGIYLVSFYQEQHTRYRKDLFELINDQTAINPNGFTQDQLRSLVDKARRERDYFLVLTGLWYILQMVDAHVDAHLKEFDLNPKLKVSLEPHMERNSMIGRSNGMSLIVKF